MKGVFHAKLILVVLAALVLGAAALLQAQTATTTAAFRASDPGVRGDPPGAGGPFLTLTTRQLEFFLAGQDEFADTDGVDDGLGPRMNLDSCAGCHAQPAVGGTSPLANPQVAFASKDGGTDSVPFFIRLDEPVREA